jgi:hypothetical protein
MAYMAIDKEYNFIIQGRFKKDNNISVWGVFDFLCRIEIK